MQREPVSTEVEAKVGTVCEPQALRLPALAEISLAVICCTEFAIFHGKRYYRVSHKERKRELCDKF